jgi:hypothetical protein
LDRRKNILGIAYGSFFLGSGLGFPTNVRILLDVSGGIAIDSTTVVVYIILLGICCSKQ